MSAHAARLRLHVVPLALALAVLPLVGGCGYTTRRLDAVTHGRTIAVLPFENLTFRRDLALRLTDAVLVELRARTSYGLASPGDADHVMEGRVYAAEAVALQRGDRTVLQQQFRGSVSVEVRDRRSGRVIRSYTATAVTEFTPDRGGESLEGSGTDELLRRLAIQIVQGLEEGL